MTVTVAVDNTASKPLTLKEEAAQTTSADLKKIAHLKNGMHYMNPYFLNIKEGFNIRDLTDPENKAHVEENLAPSIKAIGVQNPLAIWREHDEFEKREKWYIEDGHMRYYAALHAIEHLGAELRAVPVRVVPAASLAEHIFRQNVHGLGKALTQLEQGKNYRRLVNLGWTIDDIASKASTQKQNVVRMIEMDGMPFELKEAVKAGEIAPSLAHALVKEKGDAAAVETVKQAKKVAAKQAVAKAAKTPAKKNAAPAKPTVVKVTAKHLKGSTVAKVSLKKEIKEILSMTTGKDAIIYDMETGKDQNRIIITMPADLWKRLANLVGA